ncbi:hypothetical protein BDV25DRAFT_135635 [Aspergillus avenaceus]|uniref:Gamma-glutamylcyclotransferase AIG2-like domain-containing protein n=1 Tax=Aspergillus avenaceus TaxID=36643 RepID=A0A5N6U7U7_ASPAV|nr:hypothetical protein BDV25DRAFT_135635 [Aspergillus avenaceus]
MDAKKWYPTDFKQALHNSLTEIEVTELLIEPPRFVYGVLMLPTVLKYFIGTDQSVDITRRMTRARITGYKMYQFSETSTPVIIATSDPQDVVEGMLVFGLDGHQRNCIYELEGGTMDLVDVKVQIRLREGSLGTYEIRSGMMIDAGTFTWLGPTDELIPVEKMAWSLDDFLQGTFYDNIVRSQRRVSLDSSQ